MLADIGHMALATALILSLVQAWSGLHGAHLGSSVGMRIAARSALAHAILCVLAFSMLIAVFIQSDFSVRLVTLHSHTMKPLLYKISGVWGNHEGSMLLWVMFMALFGAAIIGLGRGLPPPFRARAVGIQGLTGAGFTAFLLFTSNPFARLDPVPPDGFGLNPLLQDPALALHPPLLYLGYVGFSVVFSFALAALVEGRADAKWARWVRPWVLLAWSFLTLGIVLGSVWAYYELGWGGWWFWDPVENVSFMPWLTGTALLHSVLAARSRGSFIRWILLLAIMTFSLSLTGTFIVRSGILTSVHAFAVDPERGRFILMLLAGAIGGALTLYALRAGRVTHGASFGPVSRETGLALNNIFLVAVAATVFLGTVYPLIIDSLSGDRITVGPPYFERTVAPIMGLLIVVMAVAPSLNWHADSLVRLGRMTGRLFVCTAPVFLFVFLATGNLAGSAGMSLGVWLFAGTLISYGRRLRIGSRDLRQCFKRLLRLPGSAHGFILAHVGLAVTVIGISAMGIWSQETVQRVKLGESVNLAGYQFRLTGVTQRRGANFVAETARITVEKNGRMLGQLAPEQRIYPVEQNRTTEGAMTISPLRVLYAAKGEGEAKTGWIIRAYYHPLVIWIWGGALLMAAGGFVSLADRRSGFSARSKSDTIKA